MCARAFQCQIEGGGATFCTSPKSYSGLTDGWHIFQAVDADSVHRHRLLHLDTDSRRGIWLYRGSGPGQPYVGLQLGLIVGQPGCNHVKFASSPCTREM